MLIKDDTGDYTRNSYGNEVTVDPTVTVKVINFSELQKLSGLLIPNGRIDRTITGIISLMN